MIISLWAPVDLFIGSDQLTCPAGVRLSGFNQFIQKFHGSESNQHPFKFKVLSSPLDVT